MYRVFDKFEQKWIKENVYLAPNDDLFISKKALFGTEKLSLSCEKAAVTKTPLPSKQSLR